MAKQTKAVKKKVVKVEASGEAHINATFNNIIISLTNMSGQVISWASAGKMGFKDVWMDANKLYVATNLNPFDRFMGYGNKFEPIKIRAADKLVNVKALPPTTLPNAFSVGKFNISAVPAKDRV